MKIASDHLSSNMITSDTEVIWSDWSLMRVFSDQDNLLRSNYHCSEVLIDCIESEFEFSEKSHVHSDSDKSYVG